MLQFCRDLRERVECSVSALIHPNNLSLEWQSRSNHNSRTLKEQMAVNVKVRFFHSCRIPIAVCCERLLSILLTILASLFRASSREEKTVAEILPAHLLYSSTSQHLNPK